MTFLSWSGLTLYVLLRHCFSDLLMKTWLSSNLATMYRSLGLLRPSILFNITRSPTVKSFEEAGEILELALCWSFLRASSSDFRLASDMSMGLFVSRSLDINLSEADRPPALTLEFTFLTARASMASSRIVSLAPRVSSSRLSSPMACSATGFLFGFNAAPASSLMLSFPRITSSFWLRMMD